MTAAAPEVDLLVNPLHAFLERSGWTHLRLALRAQMDPSDISRWRAARPPVDPATWRLPSEVTAHRLELATGGEIPVTAWLPLRLAVDKARRAAKATG